MKGSALEGFTALYDGTGNSDATVSMRLTCHVTLDYELVKHLQMAGDKPHRGTPIGQMRELWPFDALKRRVTSEAERFISQVRSQGYIAAEPAESMVLWGPYTEKVGQPEDWVPEAGNHTIPEHERKTATKAWGYRGDELSVDKGVAFLINGRFTRKASLGSVSEENGVLIV